MRVLDTGYASAENNMAMDTKLLQNLASESDCILHFYDWEAPSATYGYFLNPHHYLESHSSLQLARRPTGGGIIFHLWDFTFSLLVPAHHANFSLNTLDNYAYVNQKVAKALQSYLGLQTQLLDHEVKPHDKTCANFCMATPTQNDVMINGRKIGGGAQRRTRNGFLHQGTISLVPPDLDYLSTIFLQDSQLLEEMTKNSTALLTEKTKVAEVKRGLKRHLEKAFS